MTPIVQSILSIRNHAAVTLAVFLLVCLLSFRGLAQTTSPPANRLTRDPQGAITRGDVTKKQFALVCTGDSFGEGTVYILDVLKERNAKASFFVTGGFLRQPELRPQIERIVGEGHYLGPHSDSHPLYCSWEDRKKSLVTQDFFNKDLQKNIADLRALGALKENQHVLFIPPYEWYNRDQAAWCRGLGVTLINFTPGSGSNRDYAREGDKAFVPAKKIYEDILAYEQQDPHGLNGFILLMHAGSGRKDPLHVLLGQLLDELTKRDYQFVRIDSLIPLPLAGRG